jgi:hypothetical protein
MRLHQITLAGALAVFVALGATAVTVNGQAPSSAPKAAVPASKPAAPATSTAAKPPAPAISAKIPRTPDGKPDFSGVWSAFDITPLERPEGVGEFITPEERAKREAADRKARADLRIYGTVTPPGGKTTDAYNTLWRDGYWSTLHIPIYRTSQIVDPPNGRLPPSANNPEVKKINDERRVRQNRPPQGPEDRPLWTRCVRSSGAGPPIVAGGAYNNDLQIVQSNESVVIIQEMAHESQIVALDGRPHAPSSVKLIKGDSRGHWEGDTLVIDTTNFAPSTLFTASVMSVGGGTNSDKFHVVERYQMMDADNILYKFTVEDPALWTRPWSAEFVIWRLKDQHMLVEYACHEGNRSLEYALTGARALEAQGIVDPVFYGGGDEEEGLK